MSETIKLAAFCGSLRKASFNRLALKAFAERVASLLRLPDQRCTVVALANALPATGFDEVTNG